MQEFNEGDLVEAVKGEERRTGRVTKPGTHLRMQGTCLHDYERDGYTVTVIEKAAPKLPSPPTDRGYYMSEAESRTEGVLQLDRTGRWWWIGNNYQPSPESILPREVAKHGNLTRLEPVPVTAKKVLDRLSSFWEFGPPVWMRAEIKNIAAEFGITE